MDTKPLSAEFDLLIVGAGIAGLAAARVGQAAGKRVVVLEKARGVGGRLATRRLGDESFDHGAHFFSVTGEALQSELQRWESKGLADLWFSDGDRRLFKGKPSMNALAKELADGLTVHRQKLVKSVAATEDGVKLECENGQTWSGKQVLFTCPAPQSLAIVERSDLDLERALIERLSGVRYDSCITLLLRLKSDCNICEPGFLKGVDSTLGTITDVKRKGTSSVPGIVVHSTAAFAETHYEQDRAWLETAMVDAVKARFAVEIEETYLHKWKFAHRSSEENGPVFVRSESYPIWFAGDSFGAAKIEGAYESGRAAVTSMLGA